MYKIELSYYMPWEYFHEGGDIRIGYNYCVVGDYLMRDSLMIYGFVGGKYIGKLWANYYNKDFEYLIKNKKRRDKVLIKVMRYQFEEDLKYYCSVLSYVVSDVRGKYCKE